MVGLTRDCIADYHYIVSIDFHNVLDIDRRGNHVRWDGRYPTCCHEVQRFLVKLSKLAAASNGLCGACSYCHKIDTRHHVIQKACNTVESLSGLSGGAARDCIGCILLTHVPTRRGGKADV